MTEPGSDGAATGDPAVPEHLDIANLVEQVERTLLGGPRKYTRVEVTKSAGTELEEGTRLWRALGFPTVGDDDVVFTDSDVEALGLVRELTRAVPMDEELLHAMTRMLGQSYSRLASWQGQMVVELLGENPELLASQDGIVDMVEQLAGVMERVQTYVWRRQLAGAFSRIASNAAQGGALGAESSLAVGFADMSHFTSLSRRWTEAELRQVLEEFETLANDIVGEHRGRVVKTIGDEVLFVADRPEDAAAIALDLLDAVEGVEQLPDVRIGLAAGPVVERFGDVYGTTVNVASRLTSLARPGSALVDRVMAESIGEDPRFTLRSKRAESVRGYSNLRQWRLRRSTDGRSEGSRSDRDPDEALGRRR